MNTDGVIIETIAEITRIASERVAQGDGDLEVDEVKEARRIEALAVVLQSYLGQGLLKTAQENSLHVFETKLLESARKSSLELAARALILFHEIDDEFRKAQAPQAS